MAIFGLNLTNYWRIVLRRKWIILYIFLAVFLSTLFFTNLKSPVYLARAQVEIEEPKTVGEFILWGEWGEELDITDINKEVRFINSSQFRKEMIKRLSLTLKQTTQEQFKGATRGLPVGIMARQVEKSNIIEIRATASKPEQTAEMANTAARVYIDLHRKEKTKQARSFRQLLERELIALKTRLDNAEQALNSFKKREGNITLEKERIKARLVGLEFELSDLLQRYPQESPVVRQLKDGLEAVREQLKKLASKELELTRLTRNFEFELKRYNDGKNRVMAARMTEESEIPGARIVALASLPASPLGSNKLMNGFVGALVGLLLGVFFVLVMENLEISLRTIEEVESFLKLPVLGVIPYLVVKREKAKFWPRLLFRKRLLRLSRLRGQLIIHYPAPSPIAESYRSLRTRIQSCALEKGAKVLLVTSTGPREGKSITCANLAITCAQAGLRVLLVDGDLRRPILDELFGLKREPGLADCLTGITEWEEALQTIVDILLKTTEWEQILRTPGLDNLKIITSGHPPLNPTQLLSSPELKSLAQKLKAHFDLVLFDSPPVLPIADAAILGPLLDGVVLVYQTAMVAREALARAKEQLENVGSTIKGIVLNNTTREIEVYPPDAYSRYKYYEKKEKKERP